MIIILCSFKITAEWCCSTIVCIFEDILPCLLLTGWLILLNRRWKITAYIFQSVLGNFLTWKAKDVEWKRRGTHYSHQYDSITSLKSLHFHFIVYSFYPSFPKANHLFSFQVSFEKSLVWYVGLIALLSPTRNLPTWPHTLKNGKNPYHNTYKHSWAFKVV